ncbi:MAG: tryptophan synthase subunit alpha [bacterium]|jgi:tryptophan synthase alpha chain
MKSASKRMRARFAAVRKRDEAAFIPFLMTGDPDIDTTERLAIELAEGGADVLELGVPFSDPMADGPVLQRAAERALAAGTTLPGVIDLVARLRRKIDIPIVLFGYANPFLHFGCEALADALSAAGADAVLCVDMPVDEADQLRLPLAAAGLDMIFLLAPTSTRARIQRVLRSSSGFVYFVSVAGVTGDKVVEAGAISELVGAIRGETKLPVGVGFGISTPEAAAEVAAISDAVIVGSKFSRIIEASSDPDAAVAEVGELGRALKQATRRSRS